MDFYKPICKHIVIPLWAKWEGSNYLENLKYLLKSQYYSEEKIRQYQFEKLKKLLEHAYSNTAFYQRKFKSVGIHPSDIKSFSEFLSLPILTKSDVLNFRDDLVAPNVDKYKTFLTSGSTGKPLSGYIDKNSSEWKRACGRRSEIWAGHDLGERIYCLYGNPEKELSGVKKLKTVLRRILLSRTEILDLLKMNQESMLKFARTMKDKPPSLIWGHAHALYAYAKFLGKQGIFDIKPKGIYSAGMVLHDWEKAKIETVFNCQIQDRYGCEELGLIATECKKQEGLHVNTDAHYVEFLDNKGNPVKPGQKGFITITDLTNYVMPFIRYKIEDIGIYSDKKCSCGIEQPLIKKIEGRIADFLYSTRGDLISGISLTDHFAGQIPGVAQIQIIQEEIDLLLLRIVKDDGYSIKTEKIIQQLINEFFGKKMRFQYQFMKKIPLGPTGKYRFTICKINKSIMNFNR